MSSTPHGRRDGHGHRCWWSVASGRCHLAAWVLAGCCRGRWRRWWGRVALRVGERVGRCGSCPCSRRRGRQLLLSEVSRTVLFSDGYEVKLEGTYISSSIISMSSSIVIPVLFPRDAVGGSHGGNRNNGLILLFFITRALTKGSVTSCALIFYPRTDFDKTVMYVVVVPISDVIKGLQAKLLYTEISKDKAQAEVKMIYRDGRVKAASVSVSLPLSPRVLA
jgi:hypothetical protein